MEKIILSKDGHNYVVKKGEKTKLFPDWISVLKYMPSYPLHRFSTTGTPKVKGKLDIGPHDEVVRIPCISCGESFPWPTDAEYYPSLCSTRCEYDWGEINGVENEN